MHDHHPRQDAERGTGTQKVVILVIEVHGLHICADALSRHRQQLLEEEAVAAASVRFVSYAGVGGMPRSRKVS